MAGDWIKMRRELLTSPKVVRIMSACDADRFRTIGGLFSAWCLFDEQTTDGILDGYTPAVFDEIVGFRGLCEAMAAVGWIEIQQNSLVATAFSEHNGQTAKRRAQESVRKMSARNADKNADKKRPREEKRREEYLELSKDNSCPPRCVETDKPDFVFATQKGTWHLPMAKLDEYRATYSFDVASELAKASQWLRDNSGRRPRSAKGVVSFLTRWLNRVADKPGSTPYKPPADRKKDPKLDYELRRSRLIKTARSEGWDEDRLRSAIDQIRPKEAANAH